MVDQTELVAYILANIVFVAMSGLLAGLSFYAYYRKPGQKSYSLAGLGFSCIGIAGLIESTYTFVVESDYLFTGSEFLVLQAGEDIIIALGLCLLFLAITKHQPKSSNSEAHTALPDEKNYWKSEKPFDD